ncbi:hypothetical protein [Granulicella arctica]|uniref:hypothetical protein n=1 Tax=Granulicella arctica TaxID=940613 RepID=UPI0021E05495|nr:hypothetical protein [Granulicella arctica]
MRIETGSAPTLQPDKDAAQHTKLVDAAQQFEGMLLQEMLKGMQGSKDGEDGDDSGGGSNDTLRSFGTEAVARAIAKGGGVGIARQVVEKVTLEHGSGSQKVANSN